MDTKAHYVLRLQSLELWPRQGLILSSVSLKKHSTHSGCLVVDIKQRHAMEVEKDFKSLEIG